MQLMLSKRILAVIGLGVLSAAGLFAAIRLHHESPVGPASFDKALNMPPDVQRIVGTACADCHSEGTRTPWYSQIPPASWLIDRDIRMARKAMNLSKWSKQSGKTPGLAMGTLAAACAGVQTGVMPPAQYKLLHEDADLSPEDSKRFCDWTQQQIVQIAASRRAHVAETRPPY